MKELIVNNKIKVGYDDDLIFRIAFLPGQEPDLETAEKTAVVLGEWSKGIECRATLVDARDLTFIGSKVRKYFSDQKRDELVAIAIVIDSSIQHTMANLYMRFTTRATPTQIFMDIHEAEAWLREKIYGELAIH